MATIGGLTALVAGGAASPVTAKNDEELEVEDLEVETLRGSERGRAISKAMRDGRLREVVNAVQQNDLVNSRNEIAAERVSGIIDGEYVESLSVRIAYETRDSSVEAYALWNDVGDVAEGVVSEHIDTTGDGEKDHWEITTYVYDDGKIYVETELVENFLGCSSINWPCVAMIASTYAGMFGSCALCASVLGAPACALCISAVLAHLGTQTLCPWCSD